MLPSKKKLEELKNFLKKMNANLIIAFASLIVSLLALYISYDSARSSTQIASQALETSRQSNEIALGRIREPAIMQFSFGSPKEFDLTQLDSITQELKLYVTLNNDGKKNIDGVAFELIGIEPLTYLITNPKEIIRPLPSIALAINFNSAVQPGGFVHIDFRKPLLQYLSKLKNLLPNKFGTYSTTINAVLTPKGIGEQVPVGAPHKMSPRDRQLITVKFNSSLLTSEVVKKILSEQSMTHRIFSP